jgi:hypothetical protein
MTFACDHAQGLLALDALGRLDPADRPGLDVHLDGCPACRADALELTGAAAALTLADPTHLADDDPGPAGPAGLATTVLTALGRETRRHRRQRRLATAGAGLLAVAAASVALVLTLGATDPGGARTLTLTGTPGVQASARLLPESWGTRIDLDERGQGPGQVLTVSMRSEYGVRWLAGTYRTSGTGELQVTLACALPAEEITGLTVTDSAGHDVLQS